MLCTAFRVYMAICVRHISMFYVCAWVGTTTYVHTDEWKWCSCLQKVNAQQNSYIHYVHVYVDTSTYVYTCAATDWKWFNCLRRSSAFCNWQERSCVSWKLFECVYIYIYIYIYTDRMYTRESFRDQAAYMYIYAYIYTYNYIHSHTQNMCKLLHRHIVHVQVVTYIDTRHTEAICFARWTSANCFLNVSASFCSPNAHCVTKKSSQKNHHVCLCVYMHERFARWTSASCFLNVSASFCSPHAHCVTKKSKPPVEKNIKLHRNA